MEEKTEEYGMEEKTEEYGMEGRLVPFVAEKWAKGNKGEWGKREQGRVGEMVREQGKVE